MELNIIYTILLMVVLSLAALLAGRDVGRRLGLLRTPLFATLVVFTACYASTWVGRIENAVIFPVGTAIFISNFTPVLVSFLAGFAWTFPAMRSRRGVMVLSTMVGLGVIFLLAPMLRPLLMPIKLGEPVWNRGICMQTHDASCGPAAAVTLLRHHGIDSSERDMAAYCMTSRAGTEPLALFHGLMNQARDNGLTPALASGRPDDWTTLGQFPVLAMVDPPNSEYATPNRSSQLRQLLGRASDGHAVVILGRYKNGDYRVADPATGRARWSPHTFSQNFSGQALYLRQADR